jgi:hypothetical protein
MQSIAGDSDTTRSSAMRTVLSGYDDGYDNGQGLLKGTLFGHNRLAVAEPAALLEALTRLHR